MNEDKFTGLGELYAQFRPSYPEELIAYLFSFVGIGEEDVIADIGSGTGIFTKQMLEKGNTVYGVEPNADMRKIAEAALTDFKNFISVSATAENTTLPDHSIDVITVAQAFHWFDRAVFQEECRRILKPQGWVVLIWNSRDSQSRLIQENDRINRQFCPNFKGFSGGMRGGTGTDDFIDFFCGAYQTKVFSHPLRLSEQGFIGRNLSSSYALRKTDSQYSAYVAALQDLFEKYRDGDSIVMPNLTRMYIGRV